MKKGFTLVELLVVIGMIAILTGAIVSSVGKARRRAMIAKATQDVKEMTNAIAALANYTSDRTLAQFASDSWEYTSDSSLAMILGSTIDGRQVPVLYNAQVRSNGDIVDPWGRRYQFTIRQSNAISSGGNSSAPTYMTAASLPNFYRLTDKERK